MSDQIPANVANLLKNLVGAVIAQQTAINELRDGRALQADTNQRLTDAIAALQGHAETVAGETGLTVQLGDLSVVPTLQEQLTAAVPAQA